MSRDEVKACRRLDGCHFKVGSDCCNINNGRFLQPLEE